MNIDKSRLNVIEQRRNLWKRRWSRPSAGALVGFALLACADGTRLSDSTDAQLEPTLEPTTFGGSGSSAAPLTLRVLLAATVAGNAGTQSAGGVGVGGTGGSAASAGVAGVSGNAGTPPSAYCGDGYRDPIKEECDDGSGSPGSFCNWACQLQDNWASHTQGTLASGARVTRHLGRGRHPVAANANSFAVGLVEQITPSEQQVRVARYSDLGISIGDAVMSAGTWVADRADPVVAVLANGDVVEAFTELGGDGDGLGIALRRIGAGQATPDAVRYASSPSFAAQYDADILALSDRILVAYTDEYDAATGPDITLREFGLDLKPMSSLALGNSTDVEGRVALAQLGSSWGAAWRRAAADGTETIDIYDAATSVRWSVGPHLAGDSDDTPALVALDATRRLLVYTRADSPGIGKLYYAVLSTAQPGTALANAAVPLTSAYANYQAFPARRPAMLVAGSDVFLAWSSGQRNADPSYAYGEEVWFERVTATLSGTTLNVAVNGEVPLPRWAAERLGDQRAPALALLGPSTNQPGAALVSAWQDYGETLGTGSGEPEVVTQLAPLSLSRTATTPAWDCTTTATCGSGVGRCTASSQCQSTLACGYIPVGVSNGANFGYGPDVGVCVPAHCTDNVLNNGEVLVDCGGTDCGTCHCGDGIVETVFGEVCDTASNSASCDNDCSLPVCGDGLLNTAAGEECDLGTANNNGQTCTSNCKVPGPFSVWAQRTATSANSLSLTLRLVNSSGVAQSLSGVTLRYWFTAEGTSTLRATCTGWGAIGCAGVNSSVAAVSPVAVNADSVMTINLGATVTLNPGQSSPDLTITLTKQDNGNFDATNDYSYPSATLEAWNHIGMYRSTTLVWGQLPTVITSCGNGTIELGEVCDTAVANSRCRSDCLGFSPVNQTACTNANSCLGVEHYSTDVVNDNQVLPRIRLVNHSGVSIALNRIKVKYWFSSESTTEPVMGGCYAGCEPIATPTVARITPSFPTADAAITATFTSTAALEVNALTSEILLHAHCGSSWLLMNETNDWSRTGAAAFTTAPKIALYVDNVLWWGEEPK